MGIELAKAYVQIIPSAKGIKGQLTSELGGESKEAGEQSGKNLADGLIKKVKGAIAAAGIGAAIGSVVKSSLEAGGALQQSFGGLDTIYGDASGSMKRMAAEAAAAGISANDYAEQAVSFGASLKQAFGSDLEGAANAANQAIMDMADNSAKMGTDLSAIQTAYQGFAKGNYTMLDNLKLGYGGTKQEMERLLADAEKLSGQEYDISNLGDVYSAIHVIQEDLGLTGVAAAEAQGTFTGSFNAMQVAAQNLMAALTTGEDLGPVMENLVSTVSVFVGDNLIPMLGSMLETVVGMAPEFLAAAGELVGGLIQGFIEKIPELAQSAANIITNFANSIGQGSGDSSFLANAAKVITSLVVALVKAAGTLLPAVIKAIFNVFTNTDWEGLGASVAETVTSGMEELFPLAVEFVSGIVDDIGELLGFPDLSGKVSETFNAVKDAITHPIDTAKELVDKAVDKIKSIFPISMGKIFSGIKLPHFEINGGEIPWGIGGMGKRPSVDIEWYAKARTQPYVFDSPTLFGAGERGSEVLYGRDALLRDIREASAGGGMTWNVTVNGADKPEEWAHRLLREAKQYGRLA